MSTVLGTRVHWLPMTGNTHQALHTTFIPVRWSDFDRYGHLHNAYYVEIAQEARLQFAQREFGTHGHEIPAVFVRHLDIDYLRPLLPDTEQIQVSTQVVEIGTTSFTTRQELRDREGRVCAVVECVQVAVDVATSRPREIEPHELKVLTSVGTHNADDSVSPDFSQEPLDDDE